MRVESVDEVEIIRRMKEGVYDEKEYQKALAWIKAKCNPDFDKNPENMQRTKEEKATYKPTSLTVMLYDSEKSVYGFTYNTQVKPLRPVIQIQKGNALTQTFEEYAANVVEASSYDEGNKVFTYYIVKAEMELDDLTTYTYRAYDKHVGVGTETAMLTNVKIIIHLFFFNNY